MQEVMVFTKNGVVLKFPVGNIRSASRGGKGVRGINLEKDDQVVAVVSVSEVEEKK